MDIGLIGIVVGIVGGGVGFWLYEDNKSMDRFIIKNNLETKYSQFKDYQKRLKESARNRQ